MAEHFKASEFACHDGTPYPIEWRKTQLARLLVPLNRIRERAGRRVRVICGFRTPAWNRRVGGAPRSRHLTGDGADIAPIVDDHEDEDAVIDEFLEMVAGMIAAGELPEVGGIGYYRGKWAHVDVRPRPPGGHVATWNGTGVGSELA